MNGVYQDFSTKTFLLLVQRCVLKSCVVVTMEVYMGCPKSPYAQVV